MDVSPLPDVNGHLVTADHPPRTDSSGMDHARCAALHNWLVCTAPTTSFSRHTRRSGTRSRSFSPTGSTSSVWARSRPAPPPETPRRCSGARRSARGSDGRTASPRSLLASPHGSGYAPPSKRVGFRQSRPQTGRVPIRPTHSPCSCPQPWTRPWPSCSSMDTSPSAATTTVLSDWNACWTIGAGLLLMAFGPLGLKGLRATLILSGRLIRCAGGTISSRRPGNRRADPRPGHLITIRTVLEMISIYNFGFQVDLFVSDIACEYLHG